MKVTVTTVGMEILNYLLTALTYLPFEGAPRGQKFHTDGELKCGVLNWLHSQDKTA
jgi:hypothetical protein